MYQLPPPKGFTGEPRLYYDTQFRVADVHVAALEMMAAAWDVSMSEALAAAVTTAYLLVDEDALAAARRCFWPATA